MTKTFRQLTSEGLIVRADSEKIEYANISIDPQFNPAGRNDEETDDDAELYEYICSGGYIPPLEVYPTDTGVVIVEGHRRHKQIGRAIAAGKYPSDRNGRYLVKIVQFNGNDRQRAIRVVTSKKRKDLSDLQEAEMYQRLIGFDMTPADIAKDCFVPQSRVDALLALIGANHDVQKAVKNGEISRTLAVKIEKQHGEAAGAVIAAAVTKAKTSGAKKVTAATMRPWSPPARFSAPIVTNAKRLLDSMPADVVAHAAKATSFDDADEIVMVPMSSKALFFLVQTVESVEEVRVEAEQKARDKAAKAAQGKINAV